MTLTVKTRNQNNSLMKEHTSMEEEKVDEINDDDRHYDGQDKNL